MFSRRVLASFPRQRLMNRVLAAFGLLAALLLSGCLSATPTITPGPLQTPTSTPRPTATPTPLPPGRGDVPLVIGLVTDSDNADLQAAGDALAARIQRLTGLTSTANLFASHHDLLDAMASGEVQVAFLPPLTYVYASLRDIAQAAFLTNHFGIYAYGSQFIANAESGFALYYDPRSGLNSAPAAIALVQFNGKRPCWVDEGSAAGYIVPAGILAENRIQIAAPAFSQSHAAVVRSVYVKGVCDFGATFAYSGDPRTGSTVQKDLPDALDRIPIIWRSEAVIPNLNISYQYGMDSESVALLDAAFEELAQNEAGLDMLTAAADGYSIEALKPIDDSEYDPLRKFVRLLKIELSGLIGK